MIDQKIEFSLMSDRGMPKMSVSEFWSECAEHLGVEANARRRTPAHSHVPVTTNTSERVEENERPAVLSPIPCCQTAGAIQQDCATNMARMSQFTGYKRSKCPLASTEYITVASMPQIDASDQGRGGEHKPDHGSYSVRTAC